MTIKKIFLFVVVSLLVLTVSCSQPPDKKTQIKNAIEEKAPAVRDRIGQAVENRQNSASPSASEPETAPSTTTSQPPASTATSSTPSSTTGTGGSEATTSTTASDLDAQSQELDSVLADLENI